MDTPTEIDRTAPVIARHEIDIDASPAVVWDLLTDVNEWPSWQPDIAVARLAGAMLPGSAFAWQSRGLRITSKVYVVEDRARVLWGGTADGITGIHEWRFAASPYGVHVVTEESFSGAPIAADPAAMQSALDASLADWLVHLKAAAEPEE